MKTIGKLAKELDVNVETIRFYERKGLIVQPLKPDSGYRMYDETHVSQLKFILKAKALGFTLDEVASLMSMSGNCSDVESMGLQKLKLIREKIADLQRLEHVIQDMTNSCKANQDPNSCPIINSLN
ncbi:MULTISPECIES: MerR family transcriptional regulator [Pseudoalteromonas]|uniref:Mercuric resistance operon regulatory protein n=1 Tax=Pseudoalteromonas lipolytica TaxID=570156 RepID=A0ABY1GMM5_9GAMM|nr:MULTISPECIES: MerR family transcriptional regulator [Pseudoalteromonas]MBE0350392.1 MerR family transcriptional regulator, mercuric resistance operon regulatory protein [Pseudoalteromonas lipolytica LMEB 39]QMW13791.1 MerR family transcriptional regulator [Pseudoalteromonas sp. MT33b]SFT70849.1 MerR family transcriptional regulator, mercuric resistance operon regulatory protein [Pseudoalteromonas lipolytica]